MDPQTALKELQAPKELSILALSEPFFLATQDGTGDSNIRTSNASSTEGREGATPAILAADLTHYQELFSKLRFSYVEQVTKERFLRAITADQPEFVAANENVELEEKLKSDKVALKERKEEVRELVKELEEQGRQLAARKSSVCELFLQERVLTRQCRLRNCTTSDDPAIRITLLDRQPRSYHLTAAPISNPQIEQSRARYAAPANYRSSQRTRRAAHGYRPAD